MKTSATIVIVFDKSKLVGQRVRQRAGVAVQKAARDIEAQAKVAAPVDTGNLKNSIAARQSGTLEAEIEVGAEYGVYVEKGTRNQAAQPFFEPAVEAVKPSFVQALEQIISEG